MLAYAPARHARQVRPATLALVIGAHVAIVAVALAATFDIDRRPVPPPTLIYDIDTPKPPPPPEPDQPTTDMPVSMIDHAPAVVPMPIPPAFPIQQPLDLTPDVPISGTVPKPPPIPFDPPIAAPTKAVLKTAAADLRPPYPENKRQSGEEATLRLTLTIDDKGRVVSVQPVGTIDRAFFEAARRHILRRWRYTPATEGGKAVPSTVTITLRFELDA